jgi:hypothetical protein
MNSKGCGRKPVRPNFKVLSQNLLGGTGENLENSMYSIEIRPIFRRNMLPSYPCWYCLICSSTQRMEAIFFSETSETVYSFHSNCALTPKHVARLVYAADVFNKQSWTASKVWFYKLGTHLVGVLCWEIFNSFSELDDFLATMLAADNIVTDWRCVHS